MNYNFCTLFDCAYLDRGLVLYESLKQNMNCFTLYIYAFDKKAFDILREMNLDHTVITYIEDIETKQMKEIKQSRTRAEYCWTCTPAIIEYSLDKFAIDHCTYIDADIYFYADPTILLEELDHTNSSVMIIKHGFPDTKAYRRLEKRCGTYCVQFNTFYNNKEGRKVLAWWREKCMDCCSAAGEGGNFGDQKYLDHWTQDFTGVHVLSHLGAGIAPWNISRYTLADCTGNILLYEKEQKAEIPIIFYHYHALKDIDELHMNISVYCRQGRMDDSLIKLLYGTYIEQLQKTRQFLHKNYGIQYPYKSAVQEVTKEPHPVREKMSERIADKYYEIVDECRVRTRGKKDKWVIKN